MATENPYVFEQATEYHVRESVRHPDSFTVAAHLADDTLLTVKGNVTSFFGEKTMYDTDSNPLYKITENTADLKQLMYIFDYRAKAVYTLRKKAFLPGRGRGTLYVWQGKRTDGDPFLQIDTSSFRSHASVLEYATTNTLATISRSNFGARRVFFGADSYKLVVNPGVDAAFMAVLTVCSDEQYTDANR